MITVAFVIKPLRESRTHVLAALLLVFVSAQALAQQEKDKVQPAFQASGYLAQSDRDRELECNPETAKTLAKQALDTASSARETDRAMVDTLGDLKSQSNIKIVEATKRIRLLDETGKQAQRLIKQAKLESVQALLAASDPKGCYLWFKSIRSKIDENESKAASLIKQGDSVVNRKRKEAVRLYDHAKQVNVEYPGLDQKISSAKNPPARIAQPTRTPRIGNSRVPVPSPPPPPTRPVTSQTAADYFKSGSRKGTSDLAGAIEDFNRAIALDPRYVEAYYLRGIAREMKGDKAGATADYDKALELRPNYYAVTDRLLRLTGAPDPATVANRAAALEARHLAIAQVRASGGLGGAPSTILLPKAFARIDRDTFTCVLITPFHAGDEIQTLGDTSSQSWSVSRAQFAGASYPIVGMVKSGNGKALLVFPAVFKPNVDIRAGGNLRSDGYLVESKHEVEAGASVPVILVSSSDYAFVFSADPADDEPWLVGTLDPKFIQLETGPLFGPNTGAGTANPKTPSNSTTGRGSSTVLAQCPSLVDAAAKNDITTTSSLLAAGADPNCVTDADVKGWTPLMAAAKAGSTEVAKALIRAGANVNAKNGYGAAPLDIAALHGYSSNIAVVIFAAGGRGRVNYPITVAH